MKTIKKTQDIVKHILETQPDTRDCDDLLVVRVCEYMNKDSVTLPFCVVISHRKELGIPPIDTIGRYRRKLQEVYPELRPNDTVERFRESRERKFRKYSKAVDV